MTEGVDAQKKAVASGYWPLYRFNPALRAEGKNPLSVDSKAPTMSIKDFMATENRFRVVQKMFPEMAEKLGDFAQKKAKQRLKLYNELAKVDCSIDE